MKCLFISTVILVDVDIIVLTTMLLFLICRVCVLLRMVKYGGNIQRLCRQSRIDDSITSSIRQADDTYQRLTVHNIRARWWVISNTTFTIMYGNLNPCVNSYTKDTTVCQVVDCISYVYSWHSLY